MFNKFLEAARNKNAWFVITGAFIKGSKLTFTSKRYDASNFEAIHDYVELSNATIQIGLATMQVERITIPTSQISAWGSDDKSLSITNLT